MSRKSRFNAWIESKQYSIGSHYNKIIISRGHGSYYSDVHSFNDLHTKIIWFRGHMPYNGFDDEIPHSLISKMYLLKSKLQSRSRKRHFRTLLNILEKKVKYLEHLMKLMPQLNQMNSFFRQAKPVYCNCCGDKFEVTFSDHVWPSDFKYPHEQISTLYLKNTRIKNICFYCETLIKINENGARWKYDSKLVGYLTNLRTFIFSFNTEGVLLKDQDLLGVSSWNNIYYKCKEIQLNQIL